MVSSRKRIFSLVIALTLFLVWPVPAGCDTYLIFSSFGGTWHDADKDWQGDSKMCWAATAANILTWGGWQVPKFHNEELIFDEFENRWANQGGWPKDALRWWFDGTDPGDGRIDVPGGGNYWRDFSSYYRPYNPEMDQLQKLEQDLSSGYASVLWVCRQVAYIGTANHVVTAWGFDYHYEGGKKVYDAIWVTDSDDGVDALQRYPLYFHRDESRWYLGGGYAGWYIKGVDGLKANPTPHTVKYYFKYTYASGDYYTGYVYAPMNYGYNYGAGLEPNYTFSKKDEFGKRGNYEIIGIDTSITYSSSLIGKVYVTEYYDAESKMTFNVSGCGNNYLGSEYGYLCNNPNISGYRFGDYIHDPLKQEHRNNEADVSLYYEYVFSYPFGDYYTGYAYLDPGKYQLYQFIPWRTEEGWGSYLITKVDTNTVYDPAQAGQVWITLYFDHESKFHYNVTGSGNNSLGSEWGYLFKNTQLLAYRFGHAVFTYKLPPPLNQKISLIQHAEADRVMLYYFTYTYPNGDKYWGSGFTHPDDDKYVPGYTFKAAAEGGGEGVYKIEEVSLKYHDHVTPDEIGKVKVFEYYDAESGRTIREISASGDNHLGSEKGYLFGQKLREYKIGYDLAGYVIVDGKKKPIYYVFEADLGDKYTFRYIYGNGDYYEGVVYGYGPFYMVYYVGLKIKTKNELGLYGYYEITGMSTTNETTKYGQVLVNVYYDSESGKSFTPIRKSKAVGTNYLESELDYILQDGVTDYKFGQGKYEADVGDRYRFRYYYGNGDYYEGHVYRAPVNTGYYPGLKITCQNELGLAGYYEILSMSWTGDTAKYGQVYVTKYYDGDHLLPRSFTPLNSSQPLGTGLLGSEIGYIINTSNPNHKFGQGYWEADR